MPKRKEPEPTLEQPDTRGQRQKFIDTAYEHGADGDQETFRNAVRMGGNGTCLQGQG